MTIVMIMIIVIILKLAIVKAEFGWSSRGNRRVRAGEERINNSMSELETVCRG